LDETPDSPVAVLGAGDTFGEISFLISKPRTANVVAKAPCEMIVLSGESLNRFIASKPAVAEKVLLNLSRILAERLAVVTPQAVKHH
jgi:CRP/FNR family transcriptional regulator, cyclic AMP receptor protein